MRLDEGRELELIHLPGHSRGHLALVDHVTATGLIGDAVFGVATPLLDESLGFGAGVLRRRRVPRDDRDPRGPAS